MAVPREATASKISTSTSLQNIDGLNGHFTSDQNGFLEFNHEIW